ncbi:MAG: putative colanic acid biosynthesis acetyltransferase [Terracidiphilus sp.]|jgi:putative colanic acid biosynthesis acetyltransferase WcaF
MRADESEPVRESAQGSPSSGEPVLPSYQQLDRFQVPPGFRGRSKVYVQLWWLVQSTLFAMSPQAMYEWRAWLLRLFGARIGRGAIIRPSVRIPYPWKLSIGDYCHIGDEVHLYTYGEIDIGDCAVISQRSYICTGSHDYTSPTFDLYAKKIVIEAEAWVAMDVFVAPGVRIGRGAVVGARSSVFHDVPSGAIAVGTPAKVIRERRMRTNPQ